MPDPRPKPLPELALLALLAVLWGASYPLIKVALQGLPPVTLIALRVTIAAGFLLLVLRLQGAGLPRGGATWGRLLVQALLNSIGAWTVLAWGQQYVASGLAGVLNSTSPVFVFLAAWLFLRPREAGGRQLAGVLLGVAGVTLIVGLDVLAGLGREVAAQLAILAGAAMYAGAAIHGRRFAHLTPTATAAGTMLWATAWLVPASLVLDRPWTLAPSAVSLLAAAALGVLSTGVAFLIYFRLVRTLGSMGVASQSYLRAGVSVLLGCVLLGERLTPAVAVGLAAIVVGVVLINRRAGEAAPTPAPTGVTPRRSG